MDYILDTNILITYLRRNNQYSKQLDEKYAPLSGENTSIISIVSVGEIKSIAIQNNWGTKRIEKLDLLLSQFIIADIKVDSIVNRYAEIDAFSQGKFKEKKSFFTSRNMGKNDLWIAATASVLNIKLLTTDKDFNHLNNEFVNVECIKFK